MRINTNVNAINTQRNLNSVQSDLSKSIEKLSSGLRINRAGDDAAGLTISEKLRGQTRGLNQAVRNANDGLSALSIADSAASRAKLITALKSSSDWASGRSPVRFHSFVAFNSVPDALVS